MQRLIGTLSAVLLVVAIATTAFADEKESLRRTTSDRQDSPCSADPIGNRFQRRRRQGSGSLLDGKRRVRRPRRGQGRRPRRYREAVRGGVRRSQGSKLQIHVNHLRLVSGGLALVEAVAEVKPAAATGGAPVVEFVLVEQNGRWLIENAHETIAHLPPQTNHLKEIEWLVGDWSSETSKAGITLRRLAIGPPTEPS